ncbi:MAG: hypothetical protein R6U20_07895, partial [Longimonas sp.]
MYIEVSHLVLFHTACIDDAVAVCFIGTCASHSPAARPAYLFACSFRPTPAAMDDFCHLHCHTQYSLLDGA